jgi:hypothetical protein
MPKDVEKIKLNKAVERGYDKCDFCSGDVNSNRKDSRRSLRRAIEAGEVEPDTNVFDEA